MLPKELARFNPTDWAMWVTAGVGVAVAVLVVLFMVLIGRWRRRLRGSREEDVSWEDLLESLRHRRQKRANAGLPPDDDVPPDELFKELLGTVPAAAQHALASEELQFLEQGGVERRTGRRRWGNPTEIHITSLLWPGQTHGLVINRSTGGLAILLQQEVLMGATIKVHAIEAPRSIPAIKLEVRHCRKAGQLFLIGCQFSEEVPWNVRVWFG